jgi:hypothetical protein
MSKSIIVITLLFSCKRDKKPVCSKYPVLSSSGVYFQFNVVDSLGYNLFYGGSMKYSVNSVKFIGDPDPSYDSSSWFKILQDSNGFVMEGFSVIQTLYLELFPNDIDTIILC